MQARIPVIYAIIVAYNPERETFIELLRSLIAQVDFIYIVDNSPSESDLVRDFIRGSNVDLEHVGLIRLGENMGIAVALNVGIDAAIAEGAEHLLFSDQDSLPDANMVKGLTGSLRELSARGIKIGAVGPVYTDIHTQLTYPFQIKSADHFFYIRRHATMDDPFVDTLTLITSGCLVPADVLRAVGGMREDFFIDQVDIEWCHRARAHGYTLFGSAWATMHQRMGDDRLRVWYLRWRHESAYSPLRMYYRIRNFITLSKLPYVDWRWKLRSTWYLAGFVYSQAVFGAQKKESLLMCIKGIWHGVIGRMGRHTGA